VAVAWLICFVLLASVGWAAEPLPAVPLVSSPQTIVQALRGKTRSALPASDCAALEVNCEEPAQYSRLVLRFVQMDSDVELEAYLTARHPLMGRVAYVFNKRSVWHLVGYFRCDGYRWVGSQHVEVRSLTDGFPPLVLVTQDFGGSGSVALGTEAYQLRSGQLWPAFELYSDYSVTLNGPRKSQRAYLAKGRVVVHTATRTGTGGKPPVNTCEVWRWDAVRAHPRAVVEEAQLYCDVNSGLPRLDQLTPAGIPAD
jgi:hypothetical protein